MKVVRYVCKERDHFDVLLTLDDDMESPSQITIRIPEEDFAEYKYWYKNRIS